MAFPRRELRRKNNWIVTGENGFVLEVQIEINPKDIYIRMSNRSRVQEKGQMWKGQNWKNLDIISTQEIDEARKWESLQNKKG
jgi:hypothetical protein